MTEKIRIHANTLIKIAAVLGILSSIAYFNYIFDEYGLKNWSYITYVVSSILLIVSWARFKFSRAIYLLCLVILFLLNAVPLFLYINFSLVGASPIDDTGILISGLVFHMLMVILTCSCLYKLKRTNTVPGESKRKSIVKKVLIIIPFVIFAIVFIIGEILLYNDYSDRKEIDQYFIDNTPDTPIGSTKFGTYPNMPTTENISEVSDLIMQGKVKEIGDPYRQEHGEVVHNVEIVPNRVFKNSANVNTDDVIRIVTFGGMMEGVFNYALQDANFVDDEEVIVFLGRGETYYYVAYDAYGKLTITDGQVRGISYENGLIDMSLDRYIRKLEKVLKNSD